MEVVDVDPQDKPVEELIHETDWEGLLQEEGGTPAGGVQVDGEDEPVHPPGAEQGDQEPEAPTDAFSGESKWFMREGQTSRERSVTDVGAS